MLERRIFLSLRAYPRLMVKIDSEYKVHGSMVRKRIGETLHDVGGERGEARRGRGGGGGEHISRGSFLRLRSSNLRNCTALYGEICNSPPIAFTLLFFDLAFGIFARPADSLRGVHPSEFPYSSADPAVYTENNDLS